MKHIPNEYVVTRVNFVISGNTSTATVKLNRRQQSTGTRTGMKTDKAARLWAIHASARSYMPGTKLN